MPRKAKIKGKEPYLTKRMVMNAANNAVRNASKRALRVAGHILVIKNGWLVQINADGSYQRIKKVKAVKRPSKIVLD